MCAILQTLLFLVLWTTKKSTIKTDVTLKLCIMRGVYTMTSGTTLLL